MSYADAAAPHKGQKQTDAEKMPEHVPEIAHDDSDVHSLDSSGNTNDHNVGIGGTNSQKSYADQQFAEEKAQEAQKATKETADKASAEARDFSQRASKDAERLGKDAESKAKEFGKEAEKKASQFKDSASKEYSKAKKDLGVEADKAEKEAKKAEQWAEKNKRNPVVIGNAVAISALAGLLGIGAYRMHKANTLTWNVAGAWAGAVGIFAVGDYFVSQYFFKKYPPK